LLGVFFVTTAFVFFGGAFAMLFADAIGEANPLKLWFKGTNLKHFCSINHLPTLLPLRASTPVAKISPILIIQNKFYELTT
jgi:hypothetical protein